MIAVSHTWRSAAVASETETAALYRRCKWRQQSRGPEPAEAPHHDDDDGGGGGGDAVHLLRDW